MTEKHHLPSTGQLQFSYDRPESSDIQSDLRIYFQINPSTGITLTWCFAVSLFIIVLHIIGGKMTKSPVSHPISFERFSIASVREFSRSMRISGTIEALRYVPVRVPRLQGPRDFGVGYLVLNRLENTGSIVDSGSVVAEFESERLARHIEDIRSRLTVATANLEKRRAEILILQKTDMQKYFNAEYELEKARIDIRLSEVTSAIRGELMKQVFDNIRTLKNHICKEINLNKLVHSSEIRIIELGIEREQIHLIHHRNDYDRLRVIAPIGGMIIRENVFNGNFEFSQAMEGDRIFPGRLFMHIVDLSQMTVSATLNQVDAQKIRVGTEAIVMLDAYPGSQFPARVIDLGSTASAGDMRLRFPSRRMNRYIGHIPVRILIESRDERILPDLSASVDVQLSRRRQGIVIPREAIRSDRGAEIHEFVYVKEGEKYRKRRVSVQDFSDTEALIQSGIESGDRVLLGNLSEDRNDLFEVSRSSE